MDKETIKILFVEDEQIAHEFVQDAIGIYECKYDLNINFASDGQEGLERFKQSLQNNTKYDYIISDITMPKINGINMVEKIREIDNQVKIILSTAHAIQDVAKEDLKEKLNILEYYFKPYVIFKLLDKLVADFQNTPKD